MKRFDEIKAIDEGGFGIVSKCQDKETVEFVTVKTIKQRTASFGEYFPKKDVNSLRKSKHDSVIRLLQTIRTHFSLFTESEMRFIAAQILKGLADVRRHGFCHRDLKPENLLWSGDKRKLADFGVAREIRRRPLYAEYISTRWYRAPSLEKWFHQWIFGQRVV
jgi:protein kinase